MIINYNKYLENNDKTTINNIMQLTGYDGSLKSLMKIMNIVKKKIFYIYYFFKKIYNNKNKIL